MSWVATAIIGGAVIGGVASTRAAGIGAEGTDAAIAEQRRQFDINRADIAPFRQTGIEATERLRRLGAGDMSEFFTSPGFEFRREEGLRGLENRFSASGGALSGNALRRLAEFNQGLASQEFGNFFSRQAQLAGLGQGATQAGVAAGTGISGNISNALIQGGNARASGVLGVNQAIQGGLGNLLFAKGAGLFDKSGGT